jgi:hypothetical protein
MGELAEKMIQSRDVEPKADDENMPDMSVCRGLIGLAFDKDNKLRRCQQPALPRAELHDPKWPLCQSCENERAAVSRRWGKRAKHP